MERIKEKVLLYISPTQCGFTKGKTISDIIFSYKWIDAMAKQQNKQIEILELDLAKAFDSMNRSELINILQEEVLLSDDELRIAHYLLANTSLKIRINKQLQSHFNLL